MHWPWRVLDMKTVPRDPKLAIDDRRHLRIRPAELQRQWLERTARERGCRGAHRRGREGTFDARDAGRVDANCALFDYSTYRSGSTPVMLQTDVRPIFEATCALGPACHQSGGYSPNLGGPNVPLDAILQSVINVSSLSVPTMKYVVPAEPQNSYLIAEDRKSQPRLRFGLHVPNPRRLPDAGTERLAALERSGADHHARLDRPGRALTRGLASLESTVSRPTDARGMALLNARANEEPLAGWMFLFLRNLADLELVERVGHRRGVLPHEVIHRGERARLASTFRGAPIRSTSQPRFSRSPHCRACTPP